MKRGLEREKKKDFLEWFLVLQGEEEQREPMSCETIPYSVFSKLESPRFNFGPMVFCL